MEDIFNAKYRFTIDRLLFKILTEVKYKGIPQQNQIFQRKSLNRQKLGKKPEQRGMTGKTRINLQNKNVTNYVAS